MAETEILENLFVGDFTDGIAWAYGGRAVLVLSGERPGPELRGARCAWIPVAPEDPALPAQLGLAGLVMRTFAERGEPILLACPDGRALGPLALTWYLVRFCGLDSDVAFGIVCERRAAVIDCRSWLPPTSWGAE